jgi:hypothetical protein
MLDETVRQFQQLVEISRQMAQAAEHLDTESLGLLENERKTLIAQLPRKLEQLPKAIQNQIIAEIRIIQGLDSAVRDKIDPWIEQIGVLLKHLSSVSR